MFEPSEPPFEEVPPVNPDDDGPVDPDICGAGDPRGWPGPDGADGYDEADGCGVLPDPDLERAGWDALVEFEDALAVGVDELDADATLAEAGVTRRSVQRAEARLLVLAAHWADLHAVLTRPGVTGKGRERLVRLGGDGTPEIAEFAPAELGAVLGMGDTPAKGLVADAVDLRHRAAAAARRAGDTEAAERIDQTLPCPTMRGDRRPFVFSSAVLYVHLAKETLDAILAGQPYAGAGVVRAEDIGPVIADQVRHWLQHANVTVKPVVNLPGQQPVDHYESPPAMSEAIGLIRSADSWPYGTCTSRRQDNEHTNPYIPMDEGGPPGQTDPLTMSKMTRGHHRIKTLAGWTVTQIRPGAWLTRTPHRYYFLVDQHGTTPLGRL